MCRAPLLSITSRFHVPVMPSLPGGVTPTSRRISSARLSGMRIWLAMTASSRSHQPDRVKVWVVSWPSTGKVTVNSAPRTGSTPRSLNTSVSVAASLVPSRGRRPAAGSQNIQWAYCASA